MKVDKSTEWYLEDWDLAESKPVDCFAIRSKKRNFATISACISLDLFQGESGEIISADVKKSWKQYNIRKTEQLKQAIINVGLDYQKVTGIWEGSLEKSFIVWNTFYDFERFTNLILKLAKDFKQWAVCIGKADDVGADFTAYNPNDKYDIALYETNSLDNINYVKSKTFTKITLVDGLDICGTILGRKLFKTNSNGELVSSEVEPNKTINKEIVFENYVVNNLIYGACGIGGSFARQRIYEEIFGENTYPTTEITRKKETND